MSHKHLAYHRACRLRFLLAYSLDCRARQKNAYDKRIGCRDIWLCAQRLSVYPAVGNRPSHKGNTYTKKKKKTKKRTRPRKIPSTDQNSYVCHISRLTFPSKLFSMTCSSLYTTVSLRLGSTTWSRRIADISGSTAWKRPSIRAFPESMLRSLRGRMSVRICRKRRYIHLPVFTRRTYTSIDTADGGRLLGSLARINISGQVIVVAL